MVTMDINKLTDEELEGNNVDSKFYIQLFALYLSRNELIEARYLWKRIANHHKSDKELQQLNILLNALLNNNTGDFFIAVKYSWSEPIKDIMNELEANVREEVFKLTGQAYNSILEKDLLDRTKLSQEELKQKCASLNWAYTVDERHQTVIMPQRLPPNPVFYDNSENQLLKLTEFVSFLEN